jgi:hypothetical protein
MVTKAYTLLCSKDKREGYIRFLNPSLAQNAVKKITEEKLVIGEQQISARIVEGNLIYFLDN